MIDPCNDGYEEKERVRILGEAFRNDDTYSAWRDTERKLHRNIAILASVVLILACVTTAILALVFS